jgi:papilin
LKVGPCKAAFQRYYFNSATQNCELFYWGGCQPNDNNFMTLEECQKVCPPKTDPCKDEMKVGPCRGSFKRFYFDSDSKTCKVFWWGGCQPNGNNFETIEDCEGTCPVKTKNPCYEKVVSGPCKAATTRYYFDSVTSQCKLFTWGGCGANGNNFLTVEDCENTCQAGRDPCLEPQDSGMCFAAFERFAFEPVSRQCQPFTWGGCGANGNNFETNDACESSCVGDFWKQ